MMDEPSRYFSAERNSFQMYLLIFLLLLLLLPHAVPHAEFTRQVNDDPYADPRRVTEEENERLKANCGAHYLGESGTVPKSMPGIQVARNLYPWIAGLETLQKDGRYACSAVQISNRHILTAAHCVTEKKPKEELDKICSELSNRKKSGSQAYAEQLPPLTYDRIAPEQFKIVASSSCNNPQHCNDDRTTFTITKYPYVHEQYTVCESDNDLAIIALDRNVPTAVGTPICMIEEDSTLMQNLTAVGYGRDPSHNLDPYEMLQEIHIDSESVIEANSKLNASLFQKSVCQGDSGGPLVQTNHQNRFTVVGIVSTVDPYCNISLSERPMRISSFIDVRKYVNWICTSTGICPIKKVGSHADHTESPSQWIRSYEFGRH